MRPAYMCGAAGVGDLGPAAGGVASLARQARADTAGAATTLAQAPWHPPRGRGIRGGAARGGSMALSRGTRQPVGAASDRHRPVWLAHPARMAALAMRTVMGWLV
jgi:hypothetical protein